MPRNLLTTTAVALLLAAACGGGAAGSPPTPSAAAAVNTCAKAHQSKHLAYLVVQHLSGQTIERCAGFDGDAIEAGAVMNGTGIQYQVVGTMVCQIDREPQQVSACSPDQAHWSLWVYMAGAWTAPIAGYGQIQLHDREALGWRYVVSPDPSPSPPTAPRPL
jgi:hypothetical protein